MQKKNKLNKKFEAKKLFLNVKKKITIEHLEIGNQNIANFIKITKIQKSQTKKFTIIRQKLGKKNYAKNFKQNSFNNYQNITEN